VQFSTTRRLTFSFISACFLLFAPFSMGVLFRGCIFVCGLVSKRPYQTFPSSAANATLCCSSPRQLSGVDKQFGVAYCPGEELSKTIEVEFL